MPSQSKRATEIGLAILAIVIAVVVLLVSLALPQYVEMRAQRKQAEAVLSMIRSRCSRQARPEKIASGKLVFEETRGDYCVRFRSHKEGQQGSIQALHKGRTILTMIGEGLTIESGVTGQGKTVHLAGWDFIGRGSPAMIIHGPAGDLDLWTVCELTPSVKDVAKLPGAKGTVRFADVNKDGVMEAVVEDVTASALNVYPYPELILRLSNGRFALAHDLMQRAAPTAAALTKQASRIRGLCRKNNRISPDLPASMLRLIYSGHPNKAYELFDKTWPPEWPDQADYLAEFRHVLTSSRYHEFSGSGADRTWSVSEGLPAGGTQRGPGVCDQMVGSWVNVDDHLDRMIISTTRTGYKVERYYGPEFRQSLPAHPDQDALLVKGQTRDAKMHFVPNTHCITVSFGADSITYRSFKTSNNIFTCIMDGDLLQTTKLLRSKPELVKARNRNGCTPLHYAATKDCEHRTEILIRFGADINARDPRSGETPLHVAADWAAGRSMAVLIGCRADVNARALDGCTPLHYAARSGCENGVKILLENGADLSVKDKKGKTALDYAKAKGHTKIAELLMQAPLPGKVAMN